jgi:C-terminal processing protease CtpA/Prc
MSTVSPATSLVQQLADRLEGTYVFPERATRAIALLRANLAAGAYDLPAGPELCARLSADLLAATNDKHLRLLWHNSPQGSGDEAALVAALHERFRRENYGVRRVELLEGNVGLIELTIIPDVALGGRALAAAMGLVEHTDALIVDLRAALGGAPDGVAFLASFFFADGEVHLTDFVEGPAGPTRQFWTAAYLPGPRYLARPVYLLTSADTFSGGEGFAYDLQALGRATVVGETTKGGAHPSEVVSLAEHVELRLPVARPVSPITGTNWEAVGVQPDMPARAGDALGVAHRAARAADAA